MFFVYVFVCTQGIMDLIEDLNYDCNYNLFLVLYYMKTNLKPEERKRVLEWVSKVMKSNKTLNDLRLRNDFMAYLAMNVQNGELHSPFDQEPLRVPLRQMAKLLPGLEEAAMQEEGDFSLFKFIPAERGGFLIPKPAPQIGAYCYLAAINETGS